MPRHLSENKELPCLDLLEAVPEVLRGLMAGLSDEDARWKPAPERLSIAELLAHLSLMEGHRYRSRADRIMAEERPQIEDEAAPDPDGASDPEEDFAHFEEQRETNVEFLRSLPLGAGARRAVHVKEGDFTLARLVRDWAMHDLHHIREVAGIVRERIEGQR